MRSTSDAGVGRGPFERERILANHGRTGFLDDVAREHDVGVGNHDDEIVVGVAASRVTQHAPAVAEVDTCHGPHEMVRCDRFDRVELVVPLRSDRCEPFAASRCSRSQSTTMRSWPQISTPG